MNDKTNPKEKILNRIKKENIEYAESFNKSLTNQYSYSIKTTVCIDKIKKEHSIIAPQFTDDSLLIQAYSLAHELGHYYFNKGLSDINFKISHFDNTIVKYIIEKKAWERAECICIEESIPIEKEFNLVKNRSLKTYTDEIKNSLKRVIVFILNILKLYYTTLICLYLFYKMANNNIVDLFGILKHFKCMNLQSIYEVTDVLWFSYISGYIAIFLTKKSKIVN